MFIAIPLPAFHRWRLLADPEACPDAHIGIAKLTSGKRAPHGQALLPQAASAEHLPAELEELLELFARMGTWQRVQLLAHARRAA